MDIQSANLKTNLSTHFTELLEDFVNDKVPEPTTKIIPRRLPKSMMHLTLPSEIGNMKKVNA